MKKIRFFLLLALIPCAALCNLRNASAQVVISDTFAGGGDGATIEGRFPETSLPGSPWTRATGQSSLMTTLNGGLNGGFGNPLPGAFGNFQSGSGVSLASSGTYTKPTRFNISADLSPKDIVGAAFEFRGVALGFYSAVGPGQQFSQNFFTGLVLDAAGNLSIVSDPNQTGFLGPGSFASASVPYGGVFDPNAFHHLSYDVNTNTGAVSNIHLGASTANYSSLTANFFTDAATSFAGMYTSSAVASGLAAVDNFRIQVVPEPGAVTLLICASALFQGWSGRARRR